MTLRLPICSALALLFIGASAHAAPTAPLYHQVNKFTLPGSEGWDYLTVDGRNHRLYISRSTHVQVVDTTTGKLIGEVPDTSGVHGIAIDGRSGHGFTSNGRSNTVTVFDIKSLKKITEVPVGEGCDCIIFDPSTERVFTFNGRAQTSTAIDAKTNTVLGTIALPGRPEFAVADGQGSVYDNIEDKSEVVKIDAATLKVAATWPLAPGTSPSGLAIDRQHRRLFSVCDNQMMMVVNADTGHIVGSPAIGSGPDAVAFDRSSGIAFSPNGEDGTVTEVHEDTPDHYTVVGTVPTQSGARTMALDQRSHHIYVVTATVQPPPPGTTPTQRWRRSYVPGSFTVLEYAPAQ